MEKPPRYDPYFSIEFGKNSSHISPKILQLGGSVDGTGVDVGVVFLVVGVVDVVVVTGLASGGLNWQASGVSMIVTSSIAINPSVPSPLNPLNSSYETNM